MPNSGQMRNRRFVLNLKQLKFNNPYQSSLESATGSKCVGSRARLSKRNRNEYLAHAPLTASRLLLMATGRYPQAENQPHILALSVFPNT